jgi:hypothetical protein
VPIAKVLHEETWTIFIARSEGDDWPDIPVRYTSVPGSMYRPDRITLTLRRGGSAGCVYSIHGQRLKKDGTAGMNGIIDRHLRVGSQGSPEWADAVIAKVRAERNLTDEALERP